MDSFWGGCWAECRLTCRLVCVWVRVRRFFGFVLGGNRFLQCNDAKVSFLVFAAQVTKNWWFGLVVWSWGQGLVF